MSATTTSSHTPMSARELDQFRAQVRAFVAERLPERVREKVRLGVEPNKADMIAWESELRDRGWLAPIGRSNGAAPAGARRSGQCSRRRWCWVIRPNSAASPSR